MILFSYGHSFPHRPLIDTEECLVSTDSAHSNPERITTKVSHFYPHLSKVFDHPSNEEVLKTYKDLSWQRYTQKQLLL